MIEIEFEKLAWPKGLNLELLDEIIDAENPIDFILTKSFLGRKKRRIMLPSQTTFKKTISHYLWELVESKTTTWPEVKKFIQEHFGTIKNFAVSKFQIKRLHAQREKEIKNGN